MGILKWAHLPPNSLWLPRYDLSKLTTKRVFSRFWPHLYRKIGLENWKFLGFFLSTFSVLVLQTPFFGFMEIKWGQKILWERIFDFSHFWAFLGTFFLKKSEKARFWPKNGPKIRKKGENQKSASIEFFAIIWPFHNQKIGSEDPNPEK